ncbi:MAG: sulfite exporter TauE/SafE family protein [Rubritepida sp.]|nr:sulfite exporter TauE/SafE family protein [Rubritepida sp.]
MDFLALCLNDPAALTAGGGLPVLMGAMLVAGLAGGVTHCAGMCAPFVLAQGAARAGMGGAARAGMGGAARAGVGGAARAGMGGAARAGMGGGGTLARLSGAALLPYHLGRGLGYAALGALVGGAAGVVTLAGSGARPWLAVPLLAAAVAMLAQGLRRLGAATPAWAARMPVPRLPAGITRAVGRLLAAPVGWRGVVLGVLLSGLPCGLLYGALLGAAAAGSALGGALAMAAFVAGTVPALVGVGWLGRIFARRFGTVLQPAAAALFLLNAAVLGMMAAQVGGLA